MILAQSHRAEAAKLPPESETRAFDAQVRGAMGSDRQGQSRRRWAAGCPPTLRGGELMALESVPPNWEQPGEGAANGY